MPNLRNRRSREVAPTLAVTDLGGGEAELVLYGDVCEDEPRDWYTGEPKDIQTVTTQRLNRELDAIRGASHLTVRLNSCGGDVFAGIAIHNVLRSLDMPITVRIEGLAASAASVIACAGDTVVAMPGSVLMVHEPMSCLFGYYNQTDLDLVKQDLDACSRAIKAIYEQKTGMDSQSIDEMVRAETWLVGQEIVDAGFADALEDGNDGEDGEVQEQEGTEAVINGVRHDLSSCRHVPDLAAKVAASVKRARIAKADPVRVAAIKQTNQPKPPEAVTAAPVANTEEPPQAAQERGEGPMDLTELRAQHPDLVAEIEAAAARHERDRIAAIDEIAAGIPADMVADAKYGNPVSAEALALAALRADAQAGRRHLADAMADAAESGVEDVEAAPGTDDPQAAADAVAADAAAYAARIVNQINGKEVR